MASCSSGLFNSFSSLQSESVIKSDNDQRQYRRVILPNNLDVLLISDPATDKAAAALDLYVGSYQNPIKRQGLAHFLEHMLFLGTKQYPKPGAYQTFISEHGGSHNASTGLEHTNYFFDVSADHLSDALGRFAPFFTDPLFDPSYVDRERNAVESEYQLKYKNDSRRQWDVLREIANPEHPLSKFNVGNLDTLADNQFSDVRTELIDFYNKYYSANLMTLVLLGKESLDELQSLAHDKFSSIQDKQLKIEGYSAHYINPSELPMQVNVSPLKDSRELGLLFEMPKLSSYWSSKPAQYLASMIGYEGQGSLLQSLKAKGWANSLSAGLALEDRSAGLFSIDIGLTPEGDKARDQVLIELFAWIDLIKEQGIERWRQQELAAMGNIAFRFAEKQQPMSYATSIARSMHQYHGGEVLRAPYVAHEFNAQLVKNLADILSPSNMLVFAVSPDATVKNASMFYHTPYQSQALDDSYIKAIENGIAVFDLSLSGANPFIPSGLDLIDSPSYEKPVIYADKPGLRVWHFPNTEFGTPKAQLSISLASNRVADLHGFSSAKLYVAYVLDQLNVALYPALMAGLNYNITADKQGLNIDIGGYSDKQEILLQKILSVLTNPQWNQQRFEFIKKQQIRNKNNTKRDYPFRQIINYFYSVVEERWMPAGQAKVIADINMTDLQQFSSELLGELELVMLASGNLHGETLDRLIKQLQVINYKALTNHYKIAKLQQYDISRSMAIDHEDTVLIQYIQADTDTLKERALSGLLAQMISAPFYNELRTQKQLGYVVSAFSFPINRVPGICMIAQSPVASEHELKKEFIDFNQRFKQQMDNLSLAELERHKSALLVDIEKAPDNLTEYSARHLKSLSLGFNNFDFHNQLASAIIALSIADIQLAYQRLVLDKPRRLWVQTQNNPASDTDQANQTVIDKHYMYPY
jgi:secreted Zn-dependent insulinase-like peptidase